MGLANVHERSKRLMWNKWIPHLSTPRYWIDAYFPVSDLQDFIFEEEEEAISIIWTQAYVRRMCAWHHWKSSWNGVAPRRITNVQMHVQKKNIVERRPQHPILDKDITPYAQQIAMPLWNLNPKLNLWYWLILDGYRKLNHIYRGR